MIYTKDSVRFSILRVEIWSILDKVYTAFHDHGYKTIITCGTEAHGPDDPHTFGFGLDFRSKHIGTREEKEAIVAELRKALGPIYTVIFENPAKDNEHIHIQIRKDLWRTLI